MASETYSEKDIIYKEGVDAIRQNAAMYVGDTSYNGFHHLASEVIDNSLDEVLAGYASKVIVCLYKDGSCSIEDDGRGIPAEIHPEYKISTLEVILTRLNSSGKYEKTAYKKFSSGLHGIGLKCCCGLSSWLNIIVHRDGKKYYQEYIDGKLTKSSESSCNNNLHGTKIQFKPSTSIFKNVKEFDRNWFLHRLQDLAYLNSDCHISFKDERDPFLEKTYLQKGGISDYVIALLNQQPSLLKDNLNISITELDGVVKEDGSQDEMKIDVSLNYSNDDSEKVLGFTNNVYNKDGGTHISGFQTALTTTFNNYLKKNEDILSKKELKDLDGKALRGEDYRQGLIAIVSVKVSRPQFAGQTKDRLTTVEVQGAVRIALGRVLNKWIEENPALAKKIIEKAVLNYRQYLVSKKAIDSFKKETKSLLSGNTKLTDCTQDDSEKAELFIVEGDSAAGSCIDGRDASFQAVLPLGGKILNTWRSSSTKMLEHEEISAIIKSLGAGILDEFDASKCRYNKIIIMADGDIDGSHISSLILTFFFQQMKELINAGKVYIAQAPLYGFEYKYKKVKCHNCKGTKKSGNDKCFSCGGSGHQQFYVKDEKELRNIMLEVGLEGVTLTKTDDSAFMLEKKVKELVVKVQQNGDLTKLGYKTEDIKKPKVILGDSTLVKFYLGNSHKTKAIAISSLEELVDGIIKLGQLSVELKRFKGLGEMSHVQLWESAMNPQTRHLLQIKIDDLTNATNIFELLMGGNAESRRDFISTKRAY